MINQILIDAVMITNVCLYERSGRSSNLQATPLFNECPESILPRWCNTLTFSLVSPPPPQSGHVVLCCVRWTRRAHPEPPFVLSCPALSSPQIEVVNTFKSGTSFQGAGALRRQSSTTSQNQDVTNVSSPSHVSLSNALSSPTSAAAAAAAPSTGRESELCQSACLSARLQGCQPPPLFFFVAKIWAEPPLWNTYTVLDFKIDELSDWLRAECQHSAVELINESGRGWRGHLYC